MSNIHFFPAEPRTEDLAKLQNAIQECVQATFEVVGVQGLQQFFDGYKSSVDAVIKAA